MSFLAGAIVGGFLTAIIGIIITSKRMTKIYKDCNNHWKEKCSQLRKRDR